MTNYRRKKFSGGYYFFTVITHKRQEFLTDEIARNCLRNVWQGVCADHPFKTVALCLLPDHLHCIWKLPEDDYNYSMRWSLIKRFFTREWLNAGGEEMTQSLSRTKKRRRGVWQRRFWEHCIRDEEDLANHINYIHYNPVKHKLADRPGDWQWSTYHRYAKGGLNTADIEPDGNLFVGE
jgi:putative transposase